MLLVLAARIPAQISGFITALTSVLNTSGSLKNVVAVPTVRSNRSCLDRADEVASEKSIVSMHMLSRKERGSCSSWMDQKTCTSFIPSMPEVTCVCVWFFFPPISCHMPVDARCCRDVKTTTRQGDQNLESAMSV